MKPLTLYVSDSTYTSFQLATGRKNTKAAVLIREAMDYYLQEKLSKKSSLSEWKPLDLGKVKNDWADGSFREEMLDERCGL